MNCNCGRGCPDGCRGPVDKDTLWPAPSPQGPAPTPGSPVSVPSVKQAGVCKAEPGLSSSERHAARAAHLAALEENWDSYGSKRISSAAAEAALSFLRGCTDEVSARGHLYPAPNGGVQVEFSDSETEIEFSAEGKVCNV